MREIADTLRAGLGQRAARVPTRELPDWVVRLVGASFPRCAGSPRSSGAATRPRPKAHRVLGFAPRPSAETVVDCARSLLAQRSA